MFCGVQELNKINRLDPLQGSGSVYHSATSLSLGNRGRIRCSVYFLLKHVLIASANHVTAVRHNP